MGNVKKEHTSLYYTTVRRKNYAAHAFYIQMKAKVVEAVIFRDVCYISLTKEKEVCNMKKAELVKLIAKDVDVSEEKISKMVNSLFERLGDALVNGDSYNHDKFGTFKSVDRAARKGRNPQTGETVDIPPARAVKLTVSNHLIERLNSKDKA